MCLTGAEWFFWAGQNIDYREKDVENVVNADTGWSVQACVYGVYMCMRAHMFVCDTSTYETAFVIVCCMYSLFSRFTFVHRVYL